MTNNTSSLIHINRGTNGYYVVRARLPGHQKYERVGKPSKSLYNALRRLADAMSSNDYKRGDVLWCTDYYEPHQVYEMVKK